MVYLEYELSTKQVIEIHENIPNVLTDYDYAISDDFSVGDEFEQTIWINSVDENKNLTSYAAIRNNPNARRLLRENDALKKVNIDIMDATATLYEENLSLHLQLLDTMDATAMLYEEVLALKGGN